MPSQVPTYGANSMKPIVFCRHGHKGRPKGEACRECKLAQRRGENARRKARRLNPEPRPGAPERLPAGPELAQLRKLLRPTKAEWRAVETAAERIRYFLETKGAFQSGHKRFDGPNAWEVIEEATGTDQRRFHQLASMATLLHQTLDSQRVGAVWGRGRTLSPELVRRIRKIAAEGETNTTIAYVLGIGLSTVSKVLAGKTHKEAAA